MDSSPPTLRIMARGIYRTVLPTGLRPCLSIHRRPLSSGVVTGLTDIVGVHRQNTGSTTGMVQPVFHST
jgi:hypothetical protein